MLAVIVLFIWWVRAAWPWIGVMPFAFMLVSSRPGLGRVPLRAGVALLVVAAAVVAFGRVRPVSVGEAIGGLALYCVWGLFQQYVLNGFFVPRLEVVAPRR